MLQQPISACWHLRRCQSIQSIPYWDICCLLSARDDTACAEVSGLSIDNNDAVLATFEGSSEFHLSRRQECVHLALTVSVSPFKIKPSRGGCGESRGQNKCGEGYGGSGYLKPSLLPHHVPSALMWLIWSYPFSYLLT
jgi:hypothetical protein